MVDDLEQTSLTHPTLAGSSLARGELNRLSDIVFFEERIVPHDLRYRSARHHQFENEFDADARATDDGLSAEDIG